MDEFQEHVPRTATFDVGYFEAGKQHSKVWLVTSEDLGRVHNVTQGRACIASSNFANGENIDSP